MAAKVEAQEEARARLEAESCSRQAARAEEAAASWAWVTVVAMEARGREAAGWAGAGCIRLVELAVEAMLAEAARGMVDGSHLAEGMRDSVAVAVPEGKHLGAKAEAMHLGAQAAAAR